MFVGWSLGGHIVLEAAPDLRQPLAIVLGEGEQLVSLDYLQRLSVPNLWLGNVQVIAGAGHAPHRETPQEFTAMLERFIADLGDPASH